MANRRKFARAVKRAAFKRADGTCESCGVKLPTGGGGVHFDHRIPWAISQDSSAENCDCLCPGCHLDKTTRRDIPTIAKVVRIADRAIGIKKPSKKMPGGRDSGITITISHGPRLRQSQAEKHRELMAKRYGDFE